MKNRSQGFNIGLILMSILKGEIVSTETKHHSIKYTLEDIETTVELSRDDHMVLIDFSNKYCNQGHSKDPELLDQFLTDMGQLQHNPKKTITPIEVDGSMDIIEILDNYLRDECGCIECRPEQDLPENIMARFDKALTRGISIMSLMLDSKRSNMSGTQTKLAILISLLDDDKGSIIPQVILDTLGITHNEVVLGMPEHLFEPTDIEGTTILWVALRGLSLHNDSKVLNTLERKFPEKFKVYQELMDTYFGLFGYKQSELMDEATDMMI